MKIDNETAEKLQQYRININDVLIAMSGATVGKTMQIKEKLNLLINQRVGIVRAKQINHSFLFYNLNSNKFKEEILLTSVGGAQENISSESIQKKCIVNFSSGEQIKIVKFLDKKTTQFDNIILKKEDLIKRLEEAKKSLISEVITGKVKVVKTEDGYELEERKKDELKDSGVKWLGYIPKDWEVNKLKHIATLNPSKATVRKYYNENIEVSFIPMDSVRLGYIDTNQKKIINEVIDGYTLFENDDIVMAKVTPCFENKNLAICSGLNNGIGFGSTELNTIRCFKKYDIDFLFYHLQEQRFIDCATYEMTGAGGLKRIPSSFLINVQFTYPKETEKFLISACLDKKTMEIDIVINKTKYQISNIKKAKQSLISEAVTGKIEILDR